MPAGITTGVANVRHGCGVIPTVDAFHVMNVPVNALMKTKNTYALFVQESLQNFEKF